MDEAFMIVTFCVASAETGELNGSMEHTKHLFYCPHIRAGKRNVATRNKKHALGKVRSTALVGTHLA